MSIIGALFGLGAGIAGSVIGNKKQKKTEERQWNREVEMFNMQKDFQREMAEQNQNFAIESMAKSQEYQKEMNAINFEQQNQMFDKTAEYMSVGAQKERMKEAGMNPALAYGLTGGGGQSASGGGSGAGPAAGSGSGSVNPTTQAIMMGLQAKGIQSQIRVNQATAAEKIANAAKTNAEKKNIEAERPNIEAQGRNIEAGINLLNQQKLTEEERTKLTRLQGEVQEALRESTWKDWENKNKEGYILVRKMEELDATINSLNIENGIKTEAREAIVAGFFATLNQTLQSTIESQSKVALNEKQKNVLEATIRDLESVISNRDMTEEKKRQEINQRIEQMKQGMNVQISDNLRQWIYGGIEAAAKLLKH